MRHKQSYVGAATSLFTTTQFDGLGRGRKIVLPDGQQTMNVYSLQTVTSTDSTGKQIRKKIDGLGRLIESDVPGGTTIPATAGTGCATIIGTERSVTGAAATPGTESVLIGGNEQSVPGTPATIATGSVTISGSVKSVTTSTRYCADYDLQGRCVDWEFHVSADYDSGSVILTVNGHTDQTTFGQGDDVGTVANRLAGVIGLRSPFIDYSSVVADGDYQPSLSDRKLGDKLFIVNFYHLHRGNWSVFCNIPGFRKSCGRHRRGGFNVRFTRMRSDCQRNSI